MLDGERRDLDEAFSNVLQYPGDRSGSASEVWNCRCTMTSYLPKYDADDEPRETYTEWLKRKETKNYAKAQDSMFISGDASEVKYTPDIIVGEMSKSTVGKDTINAIVESDIKVTIKNGEFYSGIRGYQHGDNIVLYSNNFKSARVAAQTLIHEMAHYRFQIGGCQHAEAICFAFEKMHIMGRDYLTQEEWKKLKELAISAYPELEWEEGGYGDFEQFDFVR